MSIDRIRGSADIPLTSEGQQQARELAQAFQRLGGLNVVHASDKIRTQQTAAALGSPVITNPDLADMKYGVFEGHPSTDMIPHINQYIWHMQDEPLPGVSPFSGEPGESFNAYKQRLLGSLYKMMQDYQPNDKTGVILNRRSVKTIMGWLAHSALPTFSVDPEIVTESSDDHVKPANVLKLHKPNGKWRLTPIDLKSETKPLEPALYVIRHGMTAWNKESNE